MQPARRLKDSFNQVSLEGVVKLGTLNNPIFNLPFG
jgi:hypothetical protein